MQWKIQIWRRQPTQKTTKHMCFLSNFPWSSTCWKMLECLLTNKKQRYKSYCVVSGPSHSKGLQPFRQWTRITWQYLLEILFWILKHLEEGNKKSSNNHDESSVSYLHFVICNQYLSNSPIITSPFNFHFFEAGTLWSILKGLLAHHIQWCPHCSFAFWPGNLEQMHLMVWWYLQSSIPFSNDIESLEAFEKNALVQLQIHVTPPTKQRNERWYQKKLLKLAFKRDTVPSTFQPTKKSSHPIPIPHLLHLFSYFMTFPPPNLWAAKVKDVKGDSATCNTKELSKAARPRCRPRWQSKHPTIPSHSLLFLTGETLGFLGWLQKKHGIFLITWNVKYNLEILLRIWVKSVDRISIESLAMHVEETICQNQSLLTLTLSCHTTW